jgi:hypothetical protein
MVVWYPGDARCWRPWSTGNLQVIIVILVLVVGITSTPGQVAAMASLFAAITAALMPQPRSVMAV